ncbi:MAG: hypothetical protein FIA92_03950 [Chloroflexi bacterium]|nr:hypothetical protein [Chloroflexota bacterium]
MSKRHHASRRRAYGRRQHELHERLERRDRSQAERTWRLEHDAELEPFAFDGRGAGPAYGYSD